MLKAAGRGAWWAAKKSGQAASAGVRSAGSTGRTTPLLVGGAGVAGIGSAVVDREGPYGDLQEEVMGDRDAVRYMMQAGIRTAFSRDQRHNMPGPMEYYYGRPVNVSAMNERRSSGITNPVSGDVVFGMYNLRR